MEKFKQGFLVGAATAAHQVEGNNTNSDYWVQEHIEHSQFTEPSLDAVDHYNLYEEDIRLMSEAGLNSYRFSIEWARIQPTKDTWDFDEIDHYRNVLETCHKYNIEPIVTMHHFSSPKWLISEGGWEDPKVVDYFTKYCVKVTEELGDLMNYVCTINEANMRLQLAALIKHMMLRMQSPKVDDSSNDSDVQVGINTQFDNIQLTMIETAEAFGVQDPRKVATFLSQCSEEGDLLVMKAHNSARKAMKEIASHLKIGLTLSLHDLQALEGGELEVEREWNDEFLHYLPYLKNDDFLGVQCYSRKLFDANGVVKSPVDSKKTQMGYEDYPVAISNVVRKVALDFKGELLVTENGIATSDDSRRIEFIDEVIKELQSCINDGIPLSGYLYWSLLDNFEWQKGFGMTFGLIGVDRTTQTRFPKGSLYHLGKYTQK